MSRVSIAGYEPAHLSWSTYDGYATCGERQKLQKVLRLEQRPNWGSVGGTALHACVETIEQHAPDLGPLDEWHEYFDLTVMFQEEFDTAIAETIERSPSYTTADFYVSQGGKKGETWWRDEGPRMLARWIKWRQDTRWDVWTTPTGQRAIELDMLFTLPGDIPIKGYIDLVMVTPAGQVVVVDVKSGRPPETAGQLGIYACGLETLFGVRPSWGYFWDANKGVHSQPLNLNGYTSEYLASLLEQAIAGHNAGVFLPKPQNACAKWCGVAKYCRAVGGELSHTVPVSLVNGVSGDTSTSTE